MIDVLVLNFARPKETELCLKSIKENCKFAHYTTLLNNGDNDTDTMYQFYKDGLVNRLILDQVNLGGGFGTYQLFNNALSPYSMWIECDVELSVSITKETIDSWIQFLNTNNNKCVDLTGGICGNNIYSGRSFFINTEFYRSIKKCDENGVYSGPGPMMGNGKYLESYIQDEFKDKNYNVGHVNVLKDNGFSSIRENPDGSCYIHRPDTKELKVLKYPTEKYQYPKWSDSEWENVLNIKYWPDWDIPKNERADSFIVPHWHE